MSDTSRSTRLARNAAYGVLSWLLPLGLTLLVTPSIVRGLGTDLYGLYAIILSFISYSFAFGIGNTSRRKFERFNRRIRRLSGSILLTKPRSLSTSHHALQA